MTLAPTGTVTIACSDIESSTPLWDAVPDAMQQALELHDAILRSLLDSHDGYEFSAEGDALKVAFSTPIQAVHWCMNVQQALHDATWPGALLTQPAAAAIPHLKGLRVRMGLHMGNPICRVNPVTQRMDYFGPVVNLAARVANTPHGGQVVASQPVMDHIRNHIAGVEFKDLDTHHLKGVAHPVQIHQLLPTALASREFPPLRSLATRRTNLVSRSSSFVGRIEELGVLKGRLQGSSARLITILGPGGTGKTRLSQQVGLELPDHFSGGVWFCDLTEAWDVDGICRAVANALGITLTDRDPVTQLGNAILGRGNALLIMDNFEQVVEHANTTIGGWLQRAPGARFLVSSRERLGLEAEIVQDLEPLPPPGDRQEWGKLIRNPGVLLFVERARQVRMDFQLDEHKAKDIATIVQMLDGLPLAIELAAARVRTLSPEAILRHLKGEDGSVSLKVLRGRSRDRQARQATIRGAIQWSWDLIEPWGKGVLAQCSVFTGGFNLDAAEAVLDLSDWPEAPDIEDVLEDLVDQSLIRSFEPAFLMHENRFEMLKTIQSFAREQLATMDGSESTRMESIQQRHAAWYSKLGRPEVLAQLNGTRSPAHLPRMLQELDNLTRVTRLPPSTIPADDAVGAGLAAMELFDRQGPQISAVSIGQNLLERDDLSPSQRAKVQYRLGRTLNNVGQVQQAYDSLKGVQELVSGFDDGRLRIHVLTSLSVVYRRLGDGEAAEKTALEALELATQQQHRDLQGRVLGDLGALYLRQGRFQEARPHLLQAVELLRSTDNARQLGMVLQNLGHMALQLEDYAQARQDYEAALAMQQQVGALRNEAAVRGSLALLEAAEGRTEMSRRHYEAALLIQREAGNRRSEGILHGNLADLLLSEADLEAARRHLSQCLQRAQETGSRLVQGAFLGSLGELELRCGRLDAAVEALDSGEAHLRALDVPLELAKLLCKRVDLEHQRGDSARAKSYVEEVIQLADRLKLDANSEIRRKVDKIHAKIGES